MASSPITSWQIFGGKMERVGSKIAADSDFSHDIKRHLLLGRKPMTNLDSILKAETHFVHKGLSNQSYHFSSSHVQM